MFAIAAHGGAGDWRPDKQNQAVEGVARATNVGRDLLAAGASALDAVVATVRALEDDPLYNAGTGGALNLDGLVEMDAAVMVGSERRAGAVAGLQRVRNPIDVARAVMERTDHVLLIAEGAQRFARSLGMPDYDPITPDRRDAFERHYARLTTDGDAWLPRLTALLREFPELGHGTVGAVARDADGTLAAASSTGGVVLKLVGRVGDTPIPGAGTWADGHAAAGATGKGEIAMRMLVTHRLALLVAAGSDAQTAADQCILEARPMGDELGLIAVDHAGRVGIAHGSDAMPHAWATSEQPIVGRIRR